MIITDPADPPSALPRGTRLGEFELKRVLGAGGFGIVYLAFDHALEREVAIKEYMPVSLAGRTAAFHVSLLSQSHAESFALGLRSFVNEARLLARFDHPSLVKVHRYWEHNNTAYMAMPYYTGKNLQTARSHWLHSPDEAWVRSVLEPLLGAIERLHSEGVFHRDISPDNVILEPDGRPVLLDFGAARRVLADKSVALTAILKPAYAPIEQYGETGAVKQGPWTDLYSLGATVHYLLLGRPPAPATSRTVVDEAPPLVSQTLPGCSHAFLQTIDWMLAPRPADRPQSVAALREALERCRVQMPASARPGGARSETWQATQVLGLVGSAGAGNPDLTVIDLSRAPATVLLASRPTPGPGLDATVAMLRDGVPGDAVTVLLPAATPDGRTEPTLQQDRLPNPASATPALAEALDDPLTPTRVLAPKRAASSWRWPAATAAAIAAAGLALWLGWPQRAPSTAPVASPGPAPAVAAASAVAQQQPETAAPQPVATAATPQARPAASRALTPALTQATARPNSAAAKPAPPAPPTPTAPAVVVAGGPPSLATSITRLPAADPPAPPPPPQPSIASKPVPVPTATPPAANPTPGTNSAAATVNPVASVTPAATTSTAAAPRPAAPAPRPAERDPEPVLLAQARTLSPSERCGGRVLVALWACVERHCKADTSLREHPECVKLRREQ